MRERGFNTGRRGRGHAMTLRQRNKGTVDKMANELGTQLRLSNKESHVCNKDVIDRPPSQPKRERDQVSTNEHSPG